MLRRHGHSRVPPATRRPQLENRKGRGISGWGCRLRAGVSVHCELTESGRAVQAEAIRLFAPVAHGVERELGRATPRVRAYLLALRRALDAVGG